MTGPITAWRAAPTGRRISSTLFAVFGVGWIILTAVQGPRLVPLFLLGAFALLTAWSELYGRTRTAREDDRRLHADIWDSAYGMGIADERSNYGRHLRVRRHNPYRPRPRIVMPSDRTEEASDG